MRYFLFLLASMLAFSASLSGALAGGGMMSNQNGMTYTSDDGSRTTVITYLPTGQEIRVDGISKWIFDYFDGVTYVGNDSYAIGRKLDHKRQISVGYVLKNGEIISHGDYLMALTQYSPSTGISTIKGWSNYDSTGKVYRVRNISGNVIFEQTNAGSNNYSRYEGNLLIHQVSDISGASNSSYIGKTRIGKDMNLTGIIMKGKNPGYAVFTSYTPSMMGVGHTQVAIYDFSTKKIKKLPAMAGGSYTVEIRNPQTGQLLSVSYPVKNNGTYRIYTFDGTDTYDTMTFDDVPTLAQFGSSMLVTYKKNDRQYFRFDGKSYGPYDLVDTFNTSYGYPPVDYQNQKVVRWSVFVRKDGKDMIIANGKEMPIE